MAPSESYQHVVKGGHKLKGGGGLPTAGGVKKEGGKDGGKMMSEAVTLTYADVKTYARGLAELNGPLALTMMQEWQRDDRWAAECSGQAHGAAAFGA